MTHLRRGGLLVGLVFASGCAERGVISSPPSPPATGTWIAVAVAATAAIVVLAALIVVPAWRPGGSAFTAGLFGLQAGAATVGGAVLLGAALRGATLVTRPPDAEQAASLVQLSGLDGGDVRFFRVLAALLVVLAGLLVAILVLAARFAADDDPVERTLVCVILAIESLVAAVAVVLGLLGHRSLPLAITAAMLPVLVLALMKCWPNGEADELEVGYNGGHG